MSKPERRRLSQLPPPPSVAPIVVDPEAEKRVLNFPPASQPAGHQSSAQASPPASQQTVAEQAEPLPTSPAYQPVGEAEGQPAGQLASLPASKPIQRPTKVLLSTRIPEPLKTRLTRIAKYNDIEIESIVVRALETELQSNRYEKPAKWGREE